MTQNSLASSIDLDQPSPQVAVAIHQSLQLKPQPVFPDMASNYTQTVVIPQQQAAKAAQDARDAQAALEAQAAAQPVESAYVAPVQATDGLVGSIGYSSPFGNCTLEPGVNNPGFGNPIDWPVLTETPSIGATVLFTFNHTAVVSGLWSDGSIEVRQQNAPGMPHRIPRSEIRGYR